MGRRKSCAICGKPIGDDEEVIPYKTRTAHKKCFDSLVSYVETGKEKDRKVREKEKLKEEKKKKQNVDKTITSPSKIPLRVSEDEYKEKKTVFDLIERLTGERAKAKHYQLLESYISKYGFTYKGIGMALQYYYIDKENIIENDNFLGILPYIYDDAIKSEATVELAKEKNKKTLEELGDINKLYPRKKVITRKVTKRDAALKDIGSIGISR